MDHILIVAGELRILLTPFVGYIFKKWPGINLFSMLEQIASMLMSSNFLNEPQKVYFILQRQSTVLKEMGKSSVCPFLHVKKSMN